MRFEFLGTGGAVTTPRPTCSCPVCVEARERGVPYSRTGPSLFLHGWNVLFDTPEESKEQLNAQVAASVAERLNQLNQLAHQIRSEVAELKPGGGN